MKFNFKIQQYQTDAVENTVKVFAGQPTHDATTYRRDLGKVSGTIVYEEEYAGYRNADIELTDQELFKNIRQMQSHWDIPESAALSLTCLSADFCQQLLVHFRSGLLQIGLRRDVEDVIDLKPVVKAILKGMGITDRWRDR